MKDAQKALNIPPALAVFMFFACLYLLTSAGDFYSSDGEVMYQTMGALADRGSIALPPNPGLPQIVTAASGEHVSKYEPGMALLGMSFYRLGAWIAQHTGADRATWTRLAVSWMPALCMALALTALYKTALCLSREDSAARRGLVVALAAGLATPIWPYSRVLFAESLLAALIALAVWAGVWAQRTDGANHAARWALLAGLFVGAAAATRVINILYALPLLALITRFRVNHVGKAALFMSGLAPGVALTLFHNALRFGSLFVTGYTGESFTTPPFEGMFGLLFSSGKGIFWYAPPLIAVALLWPYLCRHNARLAWALLLMAALGVGVFGMWAVWHGGWNWGPRYLVPLLPVWMLPLVALPDRGARRLKALLAACLLAGAALQWVAVRANSNDYYAAAGVQNNSAAMQHVLFDPGASPLWAQFRLYGDGQTVPLIMARLRDTTLPNPWAWLAPVILAAGMALGAWQIGVRLI